MLGPAPGDLLCPLLLTKLVSPPFVSWPVSLIVESSSDWPVFPLQPPHMYAERLRAQLSHTTVINKRLLMHPHGPLSGVRKNFKKACPYRNLHHRISMQLRSK
jgi:hypothetical protein